MFWKIYFFLIMSLSIPLYLIGFFSIRLYHGVNPYHWAIDLVSFIFLLISLFGLAWKKKTLPRAFWVVHFPISALWNLGNAYFTYDGLFTIVITAIYLPTLIAAFLYAFRRPEIWHRGVQGLP